MINRLTEIAKRVFSRDPRYDWAKMQRLIVCEKGAVYLPPGVTGVEYLKLRDSRSPEDRYSGWGHC